MLDIIVLNNPTAIIPLANPLMSIKLSKTAIPANIPIATDIANIVPATFAICCSFPIVKILINTLSNATKPAVNAAPFTISSTDSIPISLHIPTIKSNENDTLRIKPLILASCCFLPILVTLTRASTNKVKPVANTAPFTISSTDSIPISLHIPTIKAIAIDSLIIIPPTLPTLFPALFATEVIALTNIVKPVINAIPLTRSEGDSNPICLHAFPIVITAKDILTIILVTLPISLL